MVGYEQMAVEFAIGLSGAAGGSGVAWYFFHRWMNSTDERIKAVENRQSAMAETCSSKMGAVYDRMNQKCEALDKKIEDQEDCVEGAILKVNDKLGYMSLSITKIVTVMEMQAKDPNIQKILNSGNP